MKRIFKKIIEFFNQEMTLIYFSSNKKNTFNKIFNPWKIAIVLSIIIIMGALSAHYWFIHEERLHFLDQIEKDNTYLDKEIEKLEKRVDKIKSYQDDFNKEMLNIYQHFGGIDGDSIWEKAAQRNDIKLIQDTWNLDNINWIGENTEERNLTTIEKINQSRIQLLINLSQLKEIDQYLTLTEKISSHIPLGWPIKNKIGYKTSGFGLRFSPFYDKREFHTGIDIAAAQGTPLIATAEGVVIFSGEKGAFGNVVIIRHDFGYRTIYAHNHKNLVRNGQRVKKNQIIAEVGNTGRSTGSHVHYEIRISRQYLNPWPYIISKF